MFDYFYDYDYYLFLYYICWYVIYIGNIIEVLFPATENALKRQDKREVWHCSVHLLTKVAKRWAKTQKTLNGAYTVYSELPEKLRTNSLEQVEVDDFLWIMLIQWAKLSAWHVKRSTKSTSQIERTYLTSKIDKIRLPNKASLKNLTAAARGGSYGRHKILTHKATYHELPLLPMSNLRSVVESAYHPGEGRQITDTQHFVSEFIRRIGLRRNILKLLGEPARGDQVQQTTTDTTTAITTTAAAAVSLLGGGKFTTTSRFTQEMEKLMHDCVLWDTNNLDEGYQHTLQYIHSGRLATFINTTTEMLSTSTDRINSSEKGKGLKEVEEGENQSLLSGGSVVVLLGYNPELTYALVKAAFVSYQAPIKVFMEEVRVY